MYSFIHIPVVILYVRIFFPGFSIVDFIDNLNFNFLLN